MSDVFHTGVWELAVDSQEVLLCTLSTSVWGLNSSSDHSWWEVTILSQEWGLIQHEIYDIKNILSAK